MLYPNLVSHSKTEIAEILCKMAILNRYGSYLFNCNRLLYPLTANRTSSHIDHSLS